MGTYLKFLLPFLWSPIYFNLWPQASTKRFPLHSCCLLMFFFFFSANPWDGCHVVIIPVDQQFVKSVTIWRHIVNWFVLWVEDVLNSRVFGAAMFLRKLRWDNECYTRCKRGLTGDFTRSPFKQRIHIGQIWKANGPAAVAIGLAAWPLDQVVSAHDL